MYGRKNFVDYLFFMFKKKAQNHKIVMNRYKMK